MAITMVRQPSETPNINNIDDIVGLRYAYGNQDGYVIGKGQELSYTVNGLTFTINSGRVVLQGVESDINANGVAITVDDIATKQYYTVYYEVNLGTNTTTIKSQTNTAGYPSIPKGDDLTKITNGIANLELYHFTAQNGIIADVEKLVKEICYINKNTTVYNSTKVNNLEFKLDVKGRLRIGDIIIPQKKLIYSGAVNVDSLKDIYFTEDVDDSDTIEISYYRRNDFTSTSPHRHSTSHLIRVKATQNGSFDLYTHANLYYNGFILSCANCKFIPSSDSFGCRGIDFYPSRAIKYDNGTFTFTDNDPDIYYGINRIYKVIE